MSVFVDTGPWYASIVPGDPRHKDVLAWLAANSGPLITTDYVIDETLTLLRARGERMRAIELGRQFFDLAAVAIHRIDDSDLRNAWNIFRDHPQRDWSFTDCTSRAVIERLHLKCALTFDLHFKEFGNLDVCP